MGNLCETVDFKNDLAAVISNLNSIWAGIKTDYSTTKTNKMLQILKSSGRVINIAALATVIQLGEPWEGRCCLMFVKFRKACFHSTLGLAVVLTAQYFLQ